MHMLLMTYLCCTYSEVVSRTAFGVGFLIKPVGAGKFRRRDWAGMIRRLAGARLARPSVTLCKMRVRLRAPMVAVYHSKCLYT